MLGSILLHLKYRGWVQHPHDRSGLLILCYQLHHDYLHHPHHQCLILRPQTWGHLKWAMETVLLEARGHWVHLLDLVERSYRPHTDGLSLNDCRLRTGADIGRLIV